MTTPKSGRPFSAIDGHGGMRHEIQLRPVGGGIIRVSTNAIGGACLAVVENRLATTIDLTPMDAQELIDALRTLLGDKLSKLDQIEVRP